MSGTYFKFGALVEGIATTVTSAGTTTLINTSETIQVFTGSDIETLVLPDATTMTSGMHFQVINYADGDVEVVDDGSNSIATVRQNENTIITLTDNSTSDGVWSALSGGSGGGSSVITRTGEIRVDSGNGHGSTANKIRRFSQTRVNFGTSITYADSATNGSSFTINQDGIYWLFSEDKIAVGAAEFGISLNAASLTTSISALTYAQGYRGHTSTPATQVSACSFTLYLQAGDIIRAHTDGTPDDTSENGSVFHIIGLQAISGSGNTSGEVVSAGYRLTGGQTVTAGNTDIFDFETADWDSHSAVTTGASWKFTAPNSAKFQVNVVLESTNSAFANNVQKRIWVYKNGSLHRLLDEYSSYNTPNSTICWSGGVIVDLIQGDYIDIRGFGDATDTITIVTDSNRNHITIVEVSGSSGVAEANQSSLIENIGLSTSVGSNALTINLTDSNGQNPSESIKLRIGFRHPTLDNGGYVIRECRIPTSMVVSSGSTLGHISAQSQYVYVYAIDYLGTLELAVSGQPIFDEGVLHTTTAEGGAGAADLGNVLYSTTARSNVAIRLVGRLTSTQATAGTWATAISAISLLPTAKYVSTSEVWVDTGNGHGAVGTAIRRFSATNLTVGTAITYADDANAGNSFTINEDGMYIAFYQDARNGGATVFGLSVNASSLTNAIGAFDYSAGNRGMVNSAAATVYIGITQILNLKAGDIVRAHTQGGGAGSPDATTKQQTQFHIALVQRF